MIDPKFYFEDSHIIWDKNGFTYTEPKLKRHYESIAFLGKPFDVLSNTEIYHLTELSLNEVEKRILDYALLYNHTYEVLDDYVFKSNVFWWADSYELEEDFFEFIHDICLEHYNDVKEDDEDFGLYINFTRLVLEAVEYRINKFDIYDKLSVEWQENDNIHTIVMEEYEDNLYYQVINEEKVLKCLDFYDSYIQENLLSKKDLETLQNLEKERIIKIMSCYESLEKLKSYRCSIYDTEKYLSLDKKKFSKLQKCYIIKDKNTGLYKIGKSNNPKNREKTLQAEKPTYQLIKTFNKNWESLLHKKYKEQRLRGEWFNLSKLQVEYICRHYE